MIIKNNQGFVLPCITIRTQQLLANNNYILNNKQLNYFKKKWNLIVFDVNNESIFMVKLFQQKKITNVKNNNRTW